MKKLRIKAGESSETSEPPKNGLSGIFFHRQRGNIAEEGTEESETAPKETGGASKNSKRKYDEEAYNGLAADVFESNMSHIEDEFLSAARDGSVTRLLQLLEDRKSSLRFNINTEDPLTGNTACIWAALRGNTKILEVLLEEGADISLCNHSGQTALELGSPHIRQLMTDTARLRCSLCVAAWLGSVSITKKRLKLYDVDERNSNGLTPLLLSVRDLTLSESLNNKNILTTAPLEVVTELINSGANVNARDGLGRTALHVSASSKASSALGILHRLIQANADIAAMDNCGQTALHCACAAGNTESAELLIEKGCEVNVGDKSGETPLHAASLHGHSKLCSMLVARGADLDSRNSEGLTACDVAKTRQVRNTLRKLMNSRGEGQSSRLQEEVNNQDRNENIVGQDLTTMQHDGDVCKGTTTTPGGGTVLFSRHAQASKQSSANEGKVTLSGDRLNNLISINRNAEQRASSRGMANKPTARSPPGKRKSTVKFTGSSATWRGDEKLVTSRSIESFLPQLCSSQIQIRPKSARSRERSMMKLEDLYAETEQTRLGTRSTFAQGTVCPPLYTMQDGASVTQSARPAVYPTFAADKPSRSLSGSMHRTVTSPSRLSDELVDIEDYDEEDDIMDTKYQSLRYDSTTGTHRQSKTIHASEGCNLSELGNIRSFRFEPTNFQNSQSPTEQLSNRLESSSERNFVATSGGIFGMRSRIDRSTSAPLYNRPNKAPSDNSATISNLETNRSDQMNNNGSNSEDLGSFRVNGYAIPVGGGSSTRCSSGKKFTEEYDNDNVVPERPCTIIVKGINQETGHESYRQTQDNLSKGSVTGRPHGSGSIDQSKFERLKQMASVNFLSQSCHSLSSLWQRDGFDEDSILVATSLSCGRSSNTRKKSMFPLIPRRISTDVQQDWLKTAEEDCKGLEFTDIRKIESDPTCDPGTENQKEELDMNSKPPEPIESSEPDQSVEKTCILNEADHDNAVDAEFSVGATSGESANDADKMYASLELERRNKTKDDREVKRSPKRLKKSTGTTKSKQRSKSAEGLNSKTSQKDDITVDKSIGFGKHFTESTLYLNKSKTFDASDDQEYSYMVDGVQYFSRNNKASFLRMEKAKSSITSKTQRKGTSTSKKMSNDSKLSKDASTSSKFDLVLKSNKIEKKDANISVEMKSYASKDDLCITNTEKFDTTSSEKLSTSNDDSEAITEIELSSKDEITLNESFENAAENVAEVCENYENYAFVNKPKPEHTGPVISDPFETIRLEQMAKIQEEEERLKKEKALENASRVASAVRRKSAKHQTLTSRPATSKAKPSISVRTTSAKIKQTKKTVALATTVSSRQDQRKNTVGNSKVKRRHNDQAATCKALKINKNIFDDYTDEDNIDDEVIIPKDAKLIGGIGWQVNATSIDLDIARSQLLAKQILLNADGDLDGYESWKPVRYGSDLNPAIKARRGSDNNSTPCRRCGNNLNSCYCSAENTKSRRHSSDDFVKTKPIEPNQFDNRQEFGCDSFQDEHRREKLNKTLESEENSQISQSRLARGLRKKEALVDVSTVIENDNEKRFMEQSDKSDANDERIRLSLENLELEKRCHGPTVTGTQENADSSANKQAVIGCTESNAGAEYSLHSDDYDNHEKVSDDVCDKVNNGDSCDNIADRNRNADGEDSPNDAENYGGYTNSKNAKNNYQNGRDTPDYSANNTDHYTDELCENIDDKYDNSEVNEIDKDDSESESEEDLHLDIPPVIEVTYRPTSTKTLGSRSPRFIRKHNSYERKDPTMHRIVELGSRLRHSAVRRSDLKSEEADDDSTLSDGVASRRLRTAADGFTITERARSVLTNRLSRANETSRAGSVISNLSRSTTDDVEIIQWKRGNILGKGAYGTVWCGLTNSGELIAVKMIDLDTRDMDKAEEDYAQIQQEVDILKTLKHRNIVEYLGTSLEDNVVSIFMQYIPGGSIANLLARFGALEEEVFSNYTKQILEGVVYLHDNNVIHRDIKGGNVMLMHNGVIKLIDFGCAKKLCWTLPPVNNSSRNQQQQEQQQQLQQQEDSLMLSSQAEQLMLLKSVRGTPYWMAPEVVREEGHGAPSDIWSIGCTVFEMATKKPPWAGMPASTAIFAIGSDSTPVPLLSDKFSMDARGFVEACLTRSAQRRLTAKQLLQHPFIVNPRRVRSTKSSRVLY